MLRYACCFGQRQTPGLVVQSAGQRPSWAFAAPAEAATMRMTMWGVECTIVLVPRRLAALLSAIKFLSSAGLHWWIIKCLPARVNNLPCA